jgi:hypothetical protein
VTLTQIAKQVEKYALDNAPSICTAIGVVGVVSTALLTAKASFKAAEIIEEASWIRKDEVTIHVHLTPLDKAKLVWPYFLPAVGTGTVACVAIIGANRIGSRRAAAMAAAYSISERAFAEYKEKVVEKIGEKKEQKVRSEIKQDRIDRNPVSKREVVITGNGDVLCFDSLTGRYFQSSVETLRKAENDINRQILNDNYASLSEFFSKIGLSPTAISEELGWNLDYKLELEFDTTISENDKPCLVVDYKVQPIRNYFRIH